MPATFLEKCRGESRRTQFQCIDAPAQESRGDLCGVASVERTGHASELTARARILRSALNARWLFEKLQKNLVGLSSALTDFEARKRCLGCDKPKWQSSSTAYLAQPKLPAGAGHGPSNASFGRTVNRANRCKGADWLVVKTPGVPALRCCDNPALANIPRDQGAQSASALALA
jgi:hypothetical protein